MRQGLTILACLLLGAAVCSCEKSPEQEIERLQAENYLLNQKCIRTQERANKLIGENRDLKAQQDRQDADFSGKYDKQWNAVKALRDILGFFDPDSTETDVSVVQIELERLNKNALFIPARPPLTVRRMFQEMERSIHKLTMDVKEARIEKDNFEHRWKEEEKAKRAAIQNQQKAMADLQAELKKYKDKYGDLE